MKAEKDFTRLRQMAEDFFITHNYTAKQIAEVLGVTEQTVCKWRKGREGERSWDEKKAEHALTPSKIKEILLKEALNVSKGEKTTIDADALSKITAAIDRLDKKINVRIVIEVIRELDNFIAAINPAFANEATQYHRQFIQHRISIEA